MRRDIRILLVGDEHVGKSTIITSLIKETFIPHVQRVVPEVTIPPEVTPENVTTYIVDSSSAPQDRTYLETELRKAHAICIVYSPDNPSSFDRIPTYWLPYFRSLGVNVPVVLVGNKIDLRPGEVTNEELEAEIRPIMNEFKEVETCVECSAKVPLNVSEVFYFARQAVLHPTAPLYDSREHILKPACVEALRRIFKISDVNKDGILDAHELDEFQHRCFGSPLQQQELEGIKDLIQRELPLDAGVRGGGITEIGFLYLHTVFIQRGRLETTWTVLREFGYAEDLRLTESYLSPKFDVAYDCSVELSTLGYQFFTDIFEKFDREHAGLSKAQLDDLFSTSPGNPWGSSTRFPEEIITDDDGTVSLQTWLAQWSMTTLLDYKTTLAYLAYLGYPQTQPYLINYSSSSRALTPPTTTALHITKPRKSERKRGKVTRNVFLCYVCGAAGSGKTSLLRASQGQHFSSIFEPTTKPISVVNSVEINGAEKYLVLQEFGSTYEAETLRNSKKLDLADVIVFVYDSSDTNSFSYISNVRQQYNLDHIPSMFVATKSDLDLAQQRHEVQPDVYCRRLSLQGPVAVSVKTNQMADVFQAMCSVAMHPLSAMPGGPDGAVGSGLRIRSYLMISALVSGVTIGILAYRRGPGSSGFSWLLGGSWFSWIIGRRDL